MSVPRVQRSPVLTLLSTPSSRPSTAACRPDAIQSSRVPAAAATLLKRLLKCGIAISGPERGRPAPLPGTPDPWGLIIYVYSVSEQLPPYCRAVLPWSGSWKFIINSACLNSWLQRCWLPGKESFQYLCDCGNCWGSTPSGMHQTGIQIFIGLKSISGWFVVVAAAAAINK